MKVLNDEDGTLDEFVAEDVRIVHLEATDQSQWYITIELTNGEVWQAKFGACNPNAKGYAFIEQQI